MVSEYECVLVAVLVGSGYGGGCGGRRMGRMVKGCGRGKVNWVNSLCFLTKRKKRWTFPQNSLMKEW